MSSPEDVINEYKMQEKKTSLPKYATASRWSNLDYKN